MPKPKAPAQSPQNRRPAKREPERHPTVTLPQHLSWGNAIWGQAEQYNTGQQTPSSAFLRWAIEAVYRLEDTDAVDAICDGGGDKGIDAIVLDEVAQELLILQAKWRQQHGARQGDADLKAFVGVHQYFDKGTQGIDQLLASKPNDKLIALIHRQRIKDRLQEGYKPRFRLLTNGIVDASAQSYMGTVNSREPNVLDVLDLNRLGPLADMVTLPGLLPAEFEFHAGEGKWFEEDLGGGIRIVVASLSAQELVLMPGISDRSLFDMNVRFGLGERTRVNRELAESIADSSEHSLFLAYHNGLTILCDSIAATGSIIKITNFSVANGCQSLLGLHKHTADLTSNLRLLVRFVDFSGSNSVARQIAYRTNNQNPINMRDLRANDSIQRAIKFEFSRYFGDKVDYQIKSGEPPGKGVPLANDVAAQLIMSFYLREPWNAIRRLVLFDEQYKRIFSYQVHAQHVFLAHVVQQEVDGKRGLLNPILASNFSLVRIVLIYMVSVLLDESQQGKVFKAEPLLLLQERENEVREAIGDLVEFAIESINEFIEDQIAEREGQAEDADTPLEPYDYKTSLKSRSELRKLTGAMERRFRRATRRAQDKTLLFTLEPLLTQQRASRRTAGASR